MTNLEPGVQPTEAADAPVADDGQVDATPETIEQPEPASEPEYDYLDIDDTLASKHVRVKVDGEEIAVPLNEALQGYQRQADYTQKTQEAARLRAEAEDALRLQQAIGTSPGLTVQILAQQAGVSVEEYLGMTPAQQQAAATPEVDEYADPLERALAEERRAREELQQKFEQREADEHLGRQIDNLKQTYQIGDEEVRAVVGQALQMGVGPEAFPIIYQAQAFQKLQVSTQAQQEVAAAKQAEEAARQAAAASASRVVGSGSGSAASVTQVPSANGITSPRDAVLAAFEQIEAGR